MDHNAHAGDLKTTPAARRLPRVSKLRSLRWVVTLAFILNVLGSPMAWAHAFGTTSGHATSQMAPSCHGDDSAKHGDRVPVPDSSPCCDGGGCTCAAPALSIYFLADPVRLPRLAFSAPYEPATLSAHPLDDTLRPPIR